MGRALLASFVLLSLVTTLYCSSPARAMERELGGVRLGVKVTSLLTQPGFGQPDFIGPLGAAVGGARAAAPGPPGTGTGGRSRYGPWENGPRRARAWVEGWAAAPGCPPTTPS